MTDGTGEEVREGAKPTLVTSDGAVGGTLVGDLVVLAGATLTLEESGVPEA